VVGGTTAVVEAGAVSKMAKNRSISLSCSKERKKKRKRDPAGNVTLTLQHLWYSAALLKRSQMSVEMNKSHKLILEDRKLLMVPRRR